MPIVPSPKSRRVERRSQVFNSGLRFAAYAHELVNDDRGFGDARSLRRVVAITVAVARGPKFGTSGGAKDARGFAIFGDCRLAIARQQVKRGRDLFDDRAADDWFAGRKAVQQSVVAQVVYVAWNAFRTATDVIDFARRKDVPRVRRPPHRQARSDVTCGLFDVRQCFDVAAQP